MNRDRWASRLFAAGFLGAWCAAGVIGQQAKESAGDAGALGQERKASAGDRELVAIPLKLPKPAFKGTPKHVPPGTNLEKPRKGPRPLFLAPKGVKNIAGGKPVSSSDTEPIIGEIRFVTDADKSAQEGSYVELGPGVQWVQIDLKAVYELHALVVWHYHASARVYHDVIVQVADDADFVKNVRTLFNNDHDNSAGLGVGRGKEYWETYEGKLIDAKGVQARYLRLYSNGSTEDDQNHYTEVEAFGRMANGE